MYPYQIVSHFLIHFFVFVEFRDIETLPVDIVNTSSSRVEPIPQNFLLIFAPTGGFTFLTLSHVDHILISIQKATGVHEFVRKP